MYRPQKVTYWEPCLASSDHDPFIDSLPPGVQMLESTPDLVRASLLAVPDPPPRA